MGLGGISIWQLLILLLIVVLVFGTKKLRNMGADLGTAVGNFKSAMREGQTEAEEAQQKPIAGDADTSKPATDARDKTQV